jgi:lysophospholipase L1-like esterase
MGPFAVVSNWLLPRLPRPDVIVVGDSLTAGAHASKRERAYPALTLQALRLGARGYRTSRVVGLPGGRVADLADLQVAPARRLVAVEVGTNDWLGYVREGPWSPTPLDQFASAYRRLLANLVSPGTALVCLGIWGPRAGRSEAGSLLADYDAVIDRECHRRGGRFLALADVHDDASCRGPAGRHTFLGTSDVMHPNDHGHRWLAELVIAASQKP